MKYLDAKKRLAFMMATVKYVRLAMENNPSIKVTNELIEIAMAKSLPLFPKEYTITVKDLVWVAENVKSTLLQLKYEILETDSNLLIDIKKMSRLEVNDYIHVFESLGLAPGQPTAIDLNEFINIIKALELVKLSCELPSYLPVNSVIDFINELNLSASPSRFIHTKEFIDVVTHNELTDDLSDSLGIIPQIMNVSHEVFMEFMTINESIAHDGTIDIKDSILLKVATALQLALKESDLSVTDNIIVHGSQSERIGITNNINFITKFTFDFLIMLALDINQKAETFNKVDISRIPSTTLDIEETVITEFIPELNAKITNALELNGISALSSELELDFEEFFAVDFSITQELITFEKALVELTGLTAAEIIAKLYVFNDKLPFDELKSVRLAHNYALTIKDQVTLGRFKYSILRNHDPKLLDSLDNLILDDLIFIGQD